MLFFPLILYRKCDYGCDRYLSKGNLGFFSQWYFQFLSVGGKTQDKLLGLIQMTFCIALWWARLLRLTIVSSV